MRHYRNMVLAVAVFCLLCLLDSVDVLYAQPKAGTEPIPETEMIAQEGSAAQGELQAEKQQEAKKKRKKKKSRRKKRTKKQSLNEELQVKTEESNKENKQQ